MSGSAVQPIARGPLSASLFAFLRREVDHLPTEVSISGHPLIDDDFQLALYACYELHYRGFGTDDSFEWDPQVLAFRARLEEQFEYCLRDLVPLSGIDTDNDTAVGAGEVPGKLQHIIDEFDGPSLSRYLAEDGTLEQFREFAIHRSPYQLKEADCHSWAIPRFSGGARSALIEIQMDEYGEGRPGQAHAELFADTMCSLGLDTTYGAYLDRIPGRTLATTNLISLFGLHRRLLPALLGHLAVFEMTSVGPMSRYAAACERFGLGRGGRAFYDVHVEADIIHGPLAADKMVGGHVREHPHDAALVVWGAETLMALEDLFARHLLDSWAEGSSSLRPQTVASADRSNLGAVVSSR